MKKILIVTLQESNTNSGIMEINVSATDLSSMELIGICEFLRVRALTSMNNQIQIKTGPATDNQKPA